MSKLKIWFLDVGHGDSAYIELPNGARMMIDCGGDKNWPSKLLKYYKITKQNPVPIPNEIGKYGLDKLIISHPHGDHISDITSIHDEIGFCWLIGGYRDFIDKISLDKIDFRKRGQEAGKKFIEVVKNYTAKYEESKDRVAAAKPTCLVKSRRFISYEDEMDLNELSWLVSFEIGGQKVLFTGDMTATGVNKILKSNLANEFKDFVKNTSVLKIPHHGRVNGCSQEMFDAFEKKPLVCIASDQVLNEKNEGTSNIPWYADRTSDKKLLIDEEMKNRLVLTTRKDKDIYLEIEEDGIIKISTNVFSNVRDKILT